MAFTAGQRLTAADLNNITPFRKTASASSTTQTATTTMTDLAGATVTFTAPVASTQVSVRVYLDVESTGVGDIFLAIIQVDGVTQTGEMHHSGQMRANIAQEWIVNGLSAASHTAKVRIQKVGATNNVSVYGSGHSKIVVEGNGIS